MALSTQRTFKVSERQKMNYLKEGGKKQSNKEKDHQWHQLAVPLLETGVEDKEQGRDMVS